jgi:hypothetical protein
MLANLRRASAPLTITALAMLVLLALALIGLVVDPRVVNGAPVWLKPAKFAASIAIYNLTLAWTFTFLIDWPRLRRVVGWITAVAMAIEIAIIGGQAFRGTISHFNTATPFDITLVAIMGATIVVQTLSSIAVAVALWRQAFADAALGWALRLGMTMTVVGAFTGGLMTTPTQEQLAAARAGEKMTVAGAHTVGAPDGGRGLIGTGWSTEHGDLRVPHFLGLHALQVLPIVALMLARRRVDIAARIRLVKVAAASYAALFAIVLTQALRGQSLVDPDLATLLLLATWGILTAAASADAVAARHEGARALAV